ncbi:MAG: M14 family metallopeptidase [Planctomycetota bacterium]
MTTTQAWFTLAITAASLVIVGPSLAQATVESKHEIAWNRYYTVEQTYAHMRALAEAYPELIELRSIGTSGQGRDLLVAVITKPGDDHTAKPAMWIDGSIHANEVQATEVVLYSLWYLATYYGHNDTMTELLDDYTFYLMPIVSPDSRAKWLQGPSTPHNRRSNQMPRDNDRDGLIDEDPADDLDGDGSITQMWKRDPRGEWIRDRFDDRVFSRVPDGEVGDWTYLGSEGIDDDGDGRTNEDGTDGHDMNRNWPADWQPEYVQFGAGAYPLSAPETRAVAEFCLDHPNIAAFQSYHNTGGMMLRGPGTNYRTDAYPRADLRVYDEFGRIGEQLMPYYRYLVVFSDLYNVHGGEVTWAHEGLGVISFTNELWTVRKYFQRDVMRPNDEQMRLFRDRLQFGATFQPFSEVEHPEHGSVLVGGLNKWSSRSTPVFMLEEEAHRNFAFTMLHGGEMPKLHFDRTHIQRLDDNLWELTVEIRNDKLIPTRTARASTAGIGAADLLTIDGSSVRVLASGKLDGWWDTTADEVRHEPARVQYDEGVGSRGTVVHRFWIQAEAGAELTLRYTAEKAADIELTMPLVDADGSQQTPE